MCRMYSQIDITFPIETDFKKNISEKNKNKMQILNMHVCIHQHHILLTPFLAGLNEMTINDSQLEQINTSHPTMRIPRCFKYSSK